MGEGSALDQPESALSRYRSRALACHEAQITESQSTSRLLLIDLFWTLEGVSDITRLGSGHPLISGSTPTHTIKALDDRLKEFIEKFTTGAHSLYELDLSIPHDGRTPMEIDDTPGLVEPQQNGPVLTTDAMQVDVIEKDGPLTVDASSVAVSKVTPDQDAWNRPAAIHPASPPPKKISTSPRSPNLASPTVEPSAPSKAKTQPCDSPLPPTRPPLTALSSLPTSSSHLGTRSDEHVAITRTNSFLPLEGSSQSDRHNRFVSPNYASSLPPIPLHVVASRLLTAQAATAVASKHYRRAATRSGLWIGSGGSATTKLGIKSQYTGVKSALRRLDFSKGQLDRPKLNNILTSADWKTVLDELQMARALEAIEKLKTERAWAYSQLKKPRIAHVQKSHWDHLLDEMTWLQTDFRQERRWKIVTAYRLAQQVVEWHESDALGRQRLQVEMRPKQTALVPGGLSDCRDMEIDCSSIASQIDNRAPRPCPTPTSNPAMSIDLITKEVPGSQGSARLPLTLPVSTNTDHIPDKSSSTDQESHQSSPHETRRVLQMMKRCRIPIFDMSREETVIGNNKIALESLCTKPTEYLVQRVKLHKLFGDLPLFGDLDSRPEKRVDEASPYYGRISRVATHLESKPLLVSTLQPARNCVGNQWRNLEPLTADETRDHADSKTESSHSLPHLFSGRKSKDLKELSTNNRPPPPKTTPEPRQPIEWTALDETLLRQACQTYECNWRIVADILNATSERSSTDRLSPRDCYDCWARLNSQNLSDANISSPSVKPTLDPDTPMSSQAPTVNEPTKVEAEASVEQPDAIDLSAVNGLTKRSSESRPFLPNKRTARNLALQEITQKVKDKRMACTRKAATPDQPRQVNLTSHETHTQPLRPYMTPLEMSGLKAERDRQHQVAIEFAKRQQHMAQETLLHQARAAAAQMPLRTANLNVSLPLNGNVNSRVTSQPVSVNLTQARNPGGMSGTVHRLNPSISPSFANTSSVHGVNIRSTSSPVPMVNHPHQNSTPSSDHPNNLPTAHPPLVPKLPVMPQGYQNLSTNLASTGGSATANHHGHNGTGVNRNQNGTPSSDITPLQVAQYLQQHLQQQQHHSTDHAQQHAPNHNHLFVPQSQQAPFQSGTNFGGVHSNHGASQVYRQPSPKPPGRSSPIGNSNNNNSTSSATTTATTSTTLNSTASSSPRPPPPATS